MAKIISKQEAVSMVKENDILMVGGFLNVGSPTSILEELASKGTKNLTLICNDTSFVDKGVGKLVAGKQFKKIMASHIGTNAETGNQLNSGETEVVLIPQGTLAEQIRIGGAGLGGFYTPTGIDTDAQIGKEKKTINGVDYLLELPLKANIALIKGTIVDKKGNIFFNGATRNFNPLMATAADIVIVEAEKIVEVGELSPNDVMTPGIFVDYIVLEDKKNG